MAGTEVLAVWREAYGWWQGEPYRETIRTVDKVGNLRQVEREIPHFLNSKTNQKAFVHYGTEEVFHQNKRKFRDETCAAACGQLPSSYYEMRAKERNGLQAFTPILSVKANTYVPLHVMSGYSFGQSNILAEDIPRLAAQAECPAVAITDLHSMAGLIELNRACKEHCVKAIFGASIELKEGGELVLLVKNRLGYRNLSQLLTQCHLNQPRHFPLADWELLRQYSEGLLCLTGGDCGPLDRLLIKRDLSGCQALIEKLISIYSKVNVFIELERSYLPWMVQVNRLALELAEHTGVLPFAGGKITHSRRDEFPAQDVITCAHELALIEEAIGRKLKRDENQPNVLVKPVRHLNAERFLRNSQEALSDFSDRPDLLSNTHYIASLCDDNILPDRTSLPSLYNDDAQSLRNIVEANSFYYYPKLTRKHKKRLEHEVNRITRLGFSTHFLIAADMCRWAGEQSIQYSGRGSVIDSAVAYVLGFSRIDAIAHNLHFDRFLPDDGSKRPDIDIDFEARKREDVRGYIIKRFGVERTANVAAFGSYRTRGIIRKVGKVMGLSDEIIGFLAKRIHGGVPADQLEDALMKRPELKNSSIPVEKFKWTIRLAEKLMDVPFDIGCHSSGLCISANPISETVPVMWSASPNSIETGSSEPFLRLMQWDKRSAKYYFDKFDILCLRGQDVLSGTERRVRVQDPQFDVKRIDVNDNEGFRAMRSGELIGIPQSASPAMRQAHIRLRTDNLHDASLVQAGIRPGVGGAVKINELIARRRGKPYHFEHPDFEPILGLTYGIIVFQEQVDQLLQTFCGYSSGQAEEIRDAIHKRRREDFGHIIRDKLLQAVIQRGYSQVVAEQVFDLVSGFKGYGFAQGHALAFAEISLRCVHLMQNQPAAYFAALLSAQPAGYYGPCTIANEARTRGIVFQPPDVQYSEYEFSIEDAKVQEYGLTIPGAAIRVGLMQISNLSSSTRERILLARNHLKLPIPQLVLAESTEPVTASKIKESQQLYQANQPSTVDIPSFSSFFDFTKRVQPSRDELEALILCGALDTLCSNRRAMLWAIPDAQKFAAGYQNDQVEATLPFDISEPYLNLEVLDFDTEEKAAWERSILGMDVSSHLMSYERDFIAGRAVLTMAAKDLAHGAKAIVVGNPIRLRFPPTTSGKRVVFFDLEDESGLLNVTVFDDVYQRDGKAIITSPYITVCGEVQIRDGHTAFLAHRVFEYRPRLLMQSGQRNPARGGDYLLWVGD